MGAARSMTAAIGDAARPESVGYISSRNATVRLHRGSASRSRWDTPPHSGVVDRSHDGHLPGALGVEAIFCLLALQDQVLPPLSDRRPDGCDLDYVPNES
jgi:3-oxoacyl-(acyl-carrier-protein) synthase